MADLGPSERARVRALINGWKQRAEAAEAELDALRAAGNRGHCPECGPPAEVGHEFKADDIGICRHVTYTPTPDGHRAKVCRAREDHPVHQPAEAGHAFAPGPLIADHCIAWRSVPGDGSLCGQREDHPVHSCQAHQKITEWERIAWERLEAIRRVEAVLADGPVEPDTAGGIPLTGFALDAFDAGVDAVKDLITAALGEPQPAEGDQITWPHCTHCGTPPRLCGADPDGFHRVPCVACENAPDQRTCGCKGKPFQVCDTCQNWAAARGDGSAGGSDPADTSDGER